MSSSPPLFRPKPRRPFEHSLAPQQPPSPLLAPAHFDGLPSRTHSVLNLTSSTLGGIFSPTSFQCDEQPSTPWGTGAESLQAESYRTPRRRRSSAPPPPTRSTASTVLAMVLRSILLFGLGMGYGLLVRHLHDDRQLAPFQVEGMLKPRNDWRYLLFWGVAGVALGSLMPWVDTLFEAADHDEAVCEDDESPASPNDAVAEHYDRILGADWTPVVRSVGAFVGIAFAIRKLPWASTLQASLTLFLVNPALWYLIDRSKPGFILSSLVGAAGTALLLASNPDMMPSPVPLTSASRLRNSTIKHHPLVQNGNTLAAGWLSRESVEGGIWILSVLFCSCVCFGNIGRRLALSGTGRKKASAGISPLNLNETIMKLDQQLVDGANGHNKGSPRWR